jgi:hypothetical protein
MKIELRYKEAFPIAMVPMQPVSSYSVDDVALWLFCQGMGEAVIAAFRQNDVDGSTLVALTQEELVSELGLTRLQAKRVQRSIEFTEGIVASSSRSPTADLESEVARLQKENDDLKGQLQKLQSRAPSSSSTVPIAQAVLLDPYHGGRHGNHHASPIPYSTTTPPPCATTATQESPACYSTPSTSPYPVQTSKPSKATGVATGAVTGAAGGAVSGAMKGAIVGAIVPGMSAGEGAKAGAAAGAAAGGLKGIVRAARRY